MEQEWQTGLAIIPGMIKIALEEAIKNRQADYRDDRATNKLGFSLKPAQGATSKAAPSRHPSTDREERGRSMSSKGKMGPRSRSPPFKKR